jgi:hypothetical protein
MSSIDFEKLPLAQQVELLIENWRDFNVSDRYEFKNRLLERLSLEIDEKIFERARWDEEDVEYRRIDDEIQYLQYLYAKLLEKD